MELQKYENKTVSIFLDPNAFEQAQRAAKALSSSGLVPKDYQNNIPSTLIALDIASRVGASPLMVMQHLYIVHGKPSWSSTFLIAALNSCGRFNPLKFEISGEGDQKGCIAWTTEKGSTERLESPKITMQMAKAEGWVDKNGSKWKTMPELMMRYRAAAFFSRLFAPEITMGMQTVEETQDSNTIDITAEVVSEHQNISGEAQMDSIDFETVINELENFEINLKQAQQKYKGVKFTDEQKKAIKEAGTITDEKLQKIVELIEAGRALEPFEFVLTKEQYQEVEKMLIDNEINKGK